MSSLNEAWLSWEKKKNFFFSKLAGGRSVWFGISLSLDQTSESTDHWMTSLHLIDLRFHCDNKENKIEKIEKILENLTIQTQHRNKEEEEETSIAMKEWTSERIGSLERTEKRFFSLRILSKRILYFELKLFEFFFVWLETKKKIEFFSSFLHRNESSSFRSDSIGNEFWTILSSLKDSKWKWQINFCSINFPSLH